MMTLYPTKDVMKLGNTCKHVPEGGEHGEAAEKVFNSYNL